MSGSLARSFSHRKRLMVKHIRSLSDIKLNNAWVTIGTFDGVHLGHQTILNSLRAGALEAHTPAVVLTFTPHPAIFFSKRENVTTLTTPVERAQLIGELGIDYIITVPFDTRMAQTPALDFILLLKKRLGLSWLGIGEDFTLGKGRQGDINYLRDLGEQYHYQLQVFPPVKYESQVISSSRIRAALSDGYVRLAMNLLGRPYSLSGEVIRGDGRGRTIGIPTANLLVDAEKLIPASGVYACRAKVGENRYSAAVNIGIRPTFDGAHSARWIEAHLLNFSDDLYGKNISLEFFEFLRGEQRFMGASELIEQIQKDIQRIKNIVSV